ncbi:transcriptional regulator, LacI family [Cnuella takakiae]|uniref:Transcriptional regulator, LacI family n=1 Tax=Cnuella takakiae TaxID=1302690 RepID=A0A1M4TJ15_9BACT|nr:LacI family transcriptional regulator [Cnuella takakiae]SHE44489.1 transcriptional regulator, LacI family [Cnuella takakiae]
MGDITIKELAQKLGVSISTISKALSNSHEISAATREKVLAGVRKYKYTPNPNASSLRKKRSNTIAVIIPEVADSFFSQALKGIESIAQNVDYHVLIYLTYESFYKERMILNEIKSGRVDGVLMSISSETSNSHHITALRDRNIPIVFFDRVLEETETAKVVTDDFESSFKATEHLLERGCKHIAYLSTSRHLSINNDRRNGYLEALVKHNIDPSKHTVVQCSNHPEYNLGMVRKLLQQEERPDGIIASIEKLTSSIYDVCKELNISIPGQLKVITFSNLDIASILSPSLTTITQPAFEIGRTAAAILLKALQKKKLAIRNERIVIPSVLVKRGSTN